MSHHARFTARSNPSSHKIQLSLIKAFKVVILQSCRAQLFPSLLSFGTQALLPLLAHHQAARIPFLSLLVEASPSPRRPDILFPFSRCCRLPRPHAARKNPLSLQIRVLLLLVKAPTSPRRPDILFLFSRCCRLPRPHAARKNPLSLQIRLLSLLIKAPSSLRRKIDLNKLCYRCFRVLVRRNAARKNLQIRFLSRLVKAPPS